MKKLKTVKMDISASQSATLYIIPKVPYCYFTPPYFKGIGKKPETLVFWTKRRWNAFKKGLPKDWLTK